MAINNISEANAYLSKYHNSSGTKYDLKNMTALMNHLGNPQNNLKIIHVAGTSGKTSTSYYMSALLAASGKKVGLTVSPSLDSITERTQINNRPLSEAEFCSQLYEFSSLLASLKIKSSWFEIMIAFSFWYFKKAQVDYAVIEVGMGGKLDATNVINRKDKVCIITDIGYDHQNVLGGSISEIAYHKAGIITNANVVYSYRQSEEVMTVIRRASDDQHASLNVIDSVNNPYTDVADFLHRNWYLAMKAFGHIKSRDGLLLPDTEIIHKTIYEYVPGRMDVMELGSKTVIMDGAHNPQKMTAFVSSFKKLYPGVKPDVLIAMKGGKDVSSVASIIKPFASRVITSSFTAAQDLPIKSITAKELAKSYTSSDIKVDVIQNLTLAFNELLKSNSQIVVVTGSLYLIGQLRNSLDYNI